MELVKKEGVIYLDADDFCEENHKFDVLKWIHDKSGAKFTLFTIPGRTSGLFFNRVKQNEWIDMAAHGWMHPTSRECEKWDFETSYRYLEKVEQMGYTKGFKAPGWQISDGMYLALLSRGWWVADQHYNDTRRPAALPVFFCNPDHHFHIGHMGGYNYNEIELHFDRLMLMKGEFGFIKEIILES